MVPLSHISSDKEKLGGIPQRLEKVRKAQGFEDLMAFWKALGGKEGTGVSYASARWYHQDREPSLSYVVAIWRRFGTSITWMLTGDSDPDPEGVDAQVRKLIADQADEVTGDEDSEYERDPFAFTGREIEELDALDPWVMQVLVMAAAWLTKGYRRAGVEISQREAMLLCWDVAWRPIVLAEDAMRDGEVRRFVDPTFLSSYSSSVLSSLASLGAHLATILPPTDPETDAGAQGRQREMQAQGQDPEPRVDADVESDAEA